jgi:putative membrane protein
MLILNMFRGFCMAIADSVPGVSGGTIAFLLGFYDKFIGSLDDLISGGSEKRKKAIVFLIKLGIGWIIGFCASVLILSKLFESHIYVLTSVFFGLTLFAIPVVAKEESDSLKGRYFNLIFWLLGAVLVIAITVINGKVGGSKDFDSLSAGLLIYIFVAGMCAISAMVLPGISGSTLLLCFGIYLPIINSVKELLHLNFKYLPMLFAFGFGVIAGILLIIKSVKRCLEKYRSQTIYAVLGLMTGSLYAILQGPTTLDNPKSAMTWSTFSIPAFICGGVILFLLEVFRFSMEKRAEKS